MDLLQIEPFADNEHNTPVLAIDLGTTNSLVNVITRENITHILNLQGSRIFPSILSYCHNKFYISDELSESEEFKKSTNCCIHSFKSMMGKSYEEAKEVSSMIGLQIEKKMFSSLCNIKVTKDLSLTPTEVSALLLKHLKSTAEKQLNIKLYDAVITVPAYFSERARSETKRSAEIAGLKVLRLLNEPTAAALAYDIEKTCPEDKYLVYDMGGGTFDISILNIQNSVFKVLAVGGDNNLGGNNIDYLIMEYICKKYDIELSSDNYRDFAYLLQLSCQIKESLNNNYEVIKKSILLQSKEYEIVINKEELSPVIRPIVDRTVNIMQDVISELKLSCKDITKIILVGGSTKLFLIQEEIIKIFGKNNVLCYINPDEVVVDGATEQAACLQGYKKDILLLDVVPLTLGIETYSGLMEKLIIRNTPIPAEYTEYFTTAVDNSTSIKINIYQGERELVKENILIDSFEISNIPPMPAGMAKLRITFRFDVDGLLTVTAIEETSGNAESLEVNPTKNIMDDNINEIVEESFENVKHDIFVRNLLLTREKGHKVIYVIKDAIQESRNFKEMNDIVIDEIMYNIQELSSVIDTDDIELINKKIDKLELSAKQFMQSFLHNKLMNSIVDKKIKDFL